MSIFREKLYKFPWSKMDNPGGWVEVTDECDLFCPGCYRHKLEGHRSLEDVKNDMENIIFVNENDDSISTVKVQ